jgi:hypothetical protein
MRIPRSFVVIFCAVVAIFVAGIVLALIEARRPETVFPPDSPEGVVATYLRQLQNGQTDDAFALTAFDTTSGPRQVTASDFRNQNQQWQQQSHRVTLVHATTTGDQATVAVDVTRMSAGVFGGTDSTRRVTFQLKHTEAGWRITEPVFLY